MNGQVQESNVINKVSWRLIPFLVLAYLLCYIDRVNLGFAALTMNKDIGLTATIFGWGAGIFFIGYFLFEVPSNLALEKFGARVWLARIMITWGLISAAMAMVQGPVSFIIMRFLLGASEAGFFPGVVLYLTYWYPQRYRAIIMSRFMFAQPIALMIGSAISGWILSTFDGVLGMASWKWLFIIEGLPTVLVGIIAFSYLTDKPLNANWLEPSEREWLQAEIDQERAKVESVRKYSLMESLLNPKVMVLGIIYVCIVIGVYGVNMWLPQIVKNFGGLTSSEIGIISAIPFVAAAIGMLVIGVSSDQRGERKWHLTLTILMAGVSLLVSAYTGASIVLTIALLSICSIGLYGCMPIFWTIPPTFLTGSAAAAGIALINSIGNLGGFVGPFVVGWIKDVTGNFISGLIFLGVCVLIGSLLAYRVCVENEKMQALLHKKGPAGSINA